jgi:uncharacterized protein VirK/YbjX
MLKSLRPLIGLWGHARRAVPDHVADVSMRRVRFVAQSLGHLPLAIEWYEGLGREPFAEVCTADHTLYRRLQQPYLCADWDRRRVKQVIEAHYKWARTVFPEAQFQEIYVRNSHELLSWKTDRTYVLYLRHDGKGRRFRQEGELILELECLEQPGVLASLSTTLTEAQGKRILYIGGLQGAIKELGAPAIKESTKDLHGLRPKSIVVWFAQILARRWECEDIRAVGNSNHVFCDHKRRKLAVNASMKFDYDEMWQEVGGIVLPDGFHMLPSTPERKAWDDVKPNQRSKYRKRFAMLDELEGRVLSGESAAPLAARTLAVDS